VRIAGEVDPTELLEGERNVEKRFGSSDFLANREGQAIFEGKTLRSTWLLVLYGKADKFSVASPSPNPWQAAAFRHHDGV